MAKCRAYTTPRVRIRVLAIFLIAVLGISQSGSVARAQGATKEIRIETAPFLGNKGRDRLNKYITREEKIKVFAIGVDGAYGHAYSYDDALYEVRDKAISNCLNHTSFYFFSYAENGKVVWKNPALRLKSEMPIQAQKAIGGLFEKKFARAVFNRVLVASEDGAFGARWNRKSSLEELANSAMASCEGKPNFNTENPCKIIIENEVAIAKRKRASIYSKGKFIAPSHLLAYLSPTCTYCKAFFYNIYPRIVEEYVQAGNLRIEIRMLPRSDIDVAAFSIIQCLEVDKFEIALNQFFGEQSALWKDESPWPKIREVAASLGLSEAQANHCLDNERLADSIMRSRAWLEKQIELDGAPVFIVGNEHHIGQVSYYEIKGLIDRQIEKAVQN